MSKPPSVDEALHRARLAQEERLRAIQTLVEARQNVHDVRETAARERAELEAQIKQRIADAERADRKAYSNAKKGGWSVQELRKIGFPEPARAKRSQRATPRPESTGNPEP